MPFTQDFLSPQQTQLAERWRMEALERRNMFNAGPYPARRINSIDASNAGERDRVIVTLESGDVVALRTHNDADVNDPFPYLALDALDAPERTQQSIYADFWTTHLSGRGIFSDIDEMVKETLFRFMCNRDLLYPTNPDGSVEYRNWRPVTFVRYTHLQPPFRLTLTGHFKKGRNGWGMPLKACGGSPIKSVELTTI
ncbi:MAG: hypothetical protein ABIR91_02580 [Candidatus Saccharimonadales bacterium]